MLTPSVTVTTARGSVFSGTSPPQTPHLGRLTQKTSPCGATGVELRTGGATLGVASQPTTPLSAPTHGHRAMSASDDAGAAHHSPASSLYKEKGRLTKFVDERGNFLAEIELKPCPPGEGGLRKVEIFIHPNVHSYGYYVCEVRHLGPADPGWMAIGNPRRYYGPTALRRAIKCAESMRTAREKENPREGTHLIARLRKDDLQTEEGKALTGVTS